MPSSTDKQQALVPAKVAELTVERGFGLHTQLGAFCLTFEMELPAPNQTQALD